MLKVGLTGGIGSGKTTVAQIFETLGVPVYYADERSKNILNTDPTIQTQLIELFGAEIYINGRLQNQVLAQKVFSDKEKLQQLNAIVHPAVAEDFKSWCNTQNSPYILKEAAILFEIGTYQQLDLNILISAEKALRIDRVMKRNGVSKEEVLKRMDKQWPDERKKALADFVIYNNQNESLIKQALHIHEDLIRQSNKSR